MDKYTKKEEAIRALLNDAPEQVGYSREDAADYILYMDVADVAPVVHGRWVEYQIPPIICCSNCDWATGIEEKNFQYCPNCGAKMDGGADNG